MRLGYHWDETFRQMLQTMLADQFKLVFHPDQKTLSVFALELAKGGASLQTSVEPGKPECSRSVGAGLVAEATCKSLIHHGVFGEAQGSSQYARKSRGSDVKEQIGAKRCEG